MRTVRQTRRWQRVVTHSRHARALLAALLLSLAAAAVIHAQGGSTMSAQTTNAQTTMSATEAHKRALVEAGFAAWAAGTGSPYDLLADDVAWTIVGNSDASKTYPSREAFIGEVIRPFNSRMSQGLRPTIRDLYVDGDAVVIFFDASGVAADGEPYTNTYAWFWEMRDGRVVRAHAFFDSLAFNDLWRRVSPDVASGR